MSENSSLEDIYIYTYVYNLLLNCILETNKLKRKKLNKKHGV